MTHPALSDSTLARLRRDHQRLQRSSELLQTLCDRQGRLLLLGELWAQMLAAYPSATLMNITVRWDDGELLRYRLTVTGDDGTSLLEVERDALLTIRLPLAQALYAYLDHHRGFDSNYTFLLDNHLRELREVTDAWT